MPNDYPSQAMRNGETGTVRFLLHVDASGGVSNCAVTRSSGVAALDAVTCDVVSRRARFHPARDRLGRPVSGTYANAIRWQIPQGNLAPTDRQITGTFVVERDGSVRDCRLVTFQSEDQKTLKGDAAASLRDHTERTFCTAQVNYLPYRDATGAPVSKRVTITQIVKTEALKD
ncbi:energy transducer TonB [Caenibius tardaugens]|nr:energy transducer TonB [Caenibius tardaugens]